MNGVYLITGGNLGNRQENLTKSSLMIAKLIGPIITQSAFYETSAWGKMDEPAYLNQVLYVHTNLSAMEVLEKCLAIEHNMGRIRHDKWASRLIDIDILFFNDEVYKLANLKIPHPHIAERKFVLVPLHEIAPNFVHPSLHQTIHELLVICADPLEVNLFPMH
ncbi:MAG: 2-amino-4-hydroxy-6-hydroxymethyldihydropteridine diphosphokinase [Bacteroidetes bacterium]|nr:2-amino-4-hydroxy-6-hydroxymethyldihydropteridine diphosphokinase [Bacteroidota bacterium]